MITDKERDNIRKEAKAILDNFALALDKVKIKKRELKKPVGGYREEKEGMQNNPDVKVLDEPRTKVRGHFEHPKVSNKTQGLFDFRNRMFENAPEKEKDCLIAEKKKW